MTKRWNEGDIIRLTRDCELGKDGEIFHVLVTSGAYMTARTLDAARRTVRTGRDYGYASKIGTAPVDPDDVGSPYIPSGFYRIDRDVKNPRADRRVTRDWSKAPVWAAGTEFVVREQQRMSTRHLDESVADLPPDVVAKLRARNTYTVVELAGDRHPSLHRVGPGHAEQYAALAAALVPTAESVDQFMTRIDCDSGFVKHLVGRGAIARADLEKWWREYQYGDPDDGEENAKGTDDATTLDEPAEPPSQAAPRFTEQNCPDDGFPGGYDWGSIRGAGKEK